MRKPAFCICEKEDADQLRGYSAKLISAFVFATWIVQSLFYLNPKFQASRHLLWQYSPVCVGPGREPKRLVFSQRGSYCITSSSAFNLQFRFTKICQDFIPPTDTICNIPEFPVNLSMSGVMSKPVFGVSDQVRHKSGCTVAEDGQRLDSSDLGSRGIL